MEDKKNKIDLERMANLLNDSNGYNKIETEENFLDFKNFFENSSSNINIDLEDLFNALKYKGRIAGYSNISTFEDISKDITSNIDFAENSKNAKTGLFIFFTNPNISLFSLNEVLQKVHGDISSEAEVIFGIKSDKSLKEDDIKYFVIFTGIENEILYKDNSDEKYLKLIHENRILKKQNERLENTLLSLKINKGHSYYGK